MYLETELIRKSKEYALGLLESLPDAFHYHNPEHTKEVVEAVHLICEKSNVPAKKAELVILAAWFHDIGYTSSNDEHEVESVKLMEQRLREWQANEKDIEEIGAIILATQMPQSPNNELSEILCDADLYHLSTDHFRSRTEALRKELVEAHHKDIGKLDWFKMTLEFLKKHHYFTSYGKEVLAPQKSKNIKWLENNCKENPNDKKIKKLQKKLIQLKTKAKEDKNKKPERGIETMFRITSKNHLTLSGMADNKANIMISINSIILSVLVSVLFRKFEDYPNLIIPGMILVVVCLTTIVFAVLATRPNVSSGTFTRSDIEQRKTNLLFFGNFHNMELDNYMWGMKEMMKDSEFLYGSMIKDIYFLGIVLGKKYKMLRKSYNVFMYGFITAILAFIIAMVFFPAHHAQPF